MHLLAAVEPPQIFLRQRAPAVIAAAHVVVPVHLEDVAVLLVHHEAADHELRVVLKSADRCRVPERLDHPRERHPERERLEPLQVVHRDRVVHVEADGLDLVHPQVAVDEDLARARHLAVVHAVRRGEQRLDERSVVRGFGGGGGGGRRATRGLGASRGVHPPGEITRRRRALNAPCGSGNLASGRRRGTLGTACPRGSPARSSRSRRGSRPWRSASPGSRRVRRRPGTAAPQR